MTITDMVLRLVEARTARRMHITPPTLNSTPADWDRFLAEWDAATEKGLPR